jgi:Protein of unknown function (DUF3987)
MSSTSHDTDAAVAFVYDRPFARHDLLSIDPHTSEIKAATFGNGEQTRMAAGIECCQGKVNLYLTVNELHTDAPKKKPTKADVKRMHYCVLDLDAKDVEGATHEERKRKLWVDTQQRLAEHPQFPPTYIIDSGGGFQLWWRFEPLDNTPLNAELVEGIGRTLQARFGGDSVWDICRILRLPGTINLPDAKKRAAGRVPVPSMVMQSNDHSYTIDELKAWAPPSGKASSGTTDSDPRVKAAIAELQKNWGEIESIFSPGDLPQELRDKFEAWRQKVPAIDNLANGNKSYGGDSPSDYEYALAKECNRAADFNVIEFGQLVQAYLPPTDKVFDARRLARSWVRAQDTSSHGKYTSKGFDPLHQQPDSVDEWEDPVDFWADAASPASLVTGMVPQIIEYYADDRGRRLGVEPGAVAAATMTALGSLIPAGNEVQMRQLDPHWTVKPITWLALIGEPGSNKTATISAAVGPVRHVELGWRKEYVAAQRAHELAKAKKEAEAEAEAEAGKTPMRFGTRLLQNQASGKSSSTMPPLSHCIRS